MDETSIEGFVARKYERGRKLEGWKENSDIVFGRRWIGLVVENLRRKHLVPEEDFVVLSPAANTATQEGYLKVALGNKARIVAGDLAKVKPTSGIDFVRWNARDLPVAETSVDMIFDVKGYLWHSASIDITMKYSSGGVRDTFEKYGNKLKQGGIVVVDAYKNVTTTRAGFLLWSMFGKSFGLVTEESSANMIDRALKVDNLGEIGGFEKIEVGKGLSAIRVYRKN